MLPDFQDILDRAGAPDWYDAAGTPRYGPFKPDMLGVYARIVVFYEIECQACRAKFKVAQDWDDIELWGVMHPSGPFKKRRVPTAEGLHYGDPPRHPFGGRGCVGVTMNCVDVKVLEWWEGGVSRWRRMRKKEVRLTTDHSLPAQIDRVNEALTKREKTGRAHA